MTSQIGKVAASDGWQEAEAVTTLDENLWCVIQGGGARRSWLRGQRMRTVYLMKDETDKVFEALNRCFEAVWKTFADVKFSYVNHLLSAGGQGEK